MNQEEYDLVIIGAGSGGLVAAGFAARLGARVALVERSRIGGDCTWTGCVPSKALIKAARVAHDALTASEYGVATSPPVTNMVGVREYVRRAIQQVYQFETPEQLQQQGVHVFFGSARFINSRSILLGDQVVRSRKFLITTGARPAIPAINGLSEVPFLTYDQIFDNDSLPKRMVIVGGGPVGMEIAQAYRRLGAGVTVIANVLLPKEEPEVQKLMRTIFEREGIHFIWGRAKSARKNGDAVVITTDREEISGELLLIASGRKPAVEDLDLEKAGVQYSEKGIPVDAHLRTNVNHIYAAGDVIGHYQFTHFAGWQAFQAARNALLPGSTSGFTNLVPWVTYTDPEVSHVGLTEEQARKQFGNRVRAWNWPMVRLDRAVCENDTDGFIKVTGLDKGTLLGASIVAERAGEMIAELVVAMKHNLRASDLAGVIHPYPTYSTGIQQLAAEIATDAALSGAKGKITRALLKLKRAVFMA